MLSMCGDGDCLCIDLCIQLLIAGIRIYKLLQLSTCIVYIHNICLHLLRCIVYARSGVACAVNLLSVYVYAGVTLQLNE